MRLRPNEFCPIHKSVSCCGRERLPKPALVRLGVQRVEDPHLWLLKTFRAQANVSAQQSMVESTGLFVLPMIESRLLATNKRRLSDEQKSREEEIRIYAATA